MILPFEDRVATVATLCGRGYADRLGLSHAAACYNDTLPWEMIRALRARGITEAQITTMLVDNPRRRRPRLPNGSRYSPAMSPANAVAFRAVNA